MLRRLGGGVTDVKAPAPVASAESAAKVLGPAGEILKRALQLLSEAKGEAWVMKATVWPMIKRLDPTFDTKDHGHATFGEMLRAHDDVIEIKKGEVDHLLRLR